MRLTKQQKLYIKNTKWIFDIGCVLIWKWVRWRFFHWTMWMKEAIGLLNITRANEIRNLTIFSFGMNAICQHTYCKISEDDFHNECLWNIHPSGTNVSINLPWPPLDIHTYIRPVPPNLFSFLFPISLFDVLWSCHFSYLASHRGLNMCFPTARSTP